MKPNLTGDPLFSLGARILRDGDGGAGGGGAGGGDSGNTSGKSTGTSAAAGYGQAAASMGAAGIGSVGGKSTGGQASAASPAGGAAAASGHAPGTGVGSASGGGYSGGRSSGPSASSPAGGAQAAGGFAPGTGGRGGFSGATGGGFGPAPSSPADGAQAAGGFTDGSRGGMGYGPAPSSPAGGAQAAGGYTDGSRGVGPTAYSGTSPGRPDNANAAGPKGMGGLGGLYADAGYMGRIGNAADVYGQAAKSALSVGIGNVAGRIGITEAFLGPVVDNIIGVESRYDPDAKNPRSSASGLGQFTDATFAATISKHAPELANNMTASQVMGLKSTNPAQYASIMSMKNDPTIATAMTKALATENAVTLSKNNISVTPASLYAAHFLGSTGAVKSYSVDPNTPTSNVLSKDAIAANPGVPGMSATGTIGQVLGFVESKMAPATAAVGLGNVATGKIGVPGTSVASPASTPSSVAPTAPSISTTLSPVPSTSQVAPVAPPTSKVATPKSFQDKYLAPHTVEKQEVQSKPSLGKQIGAMAIDTALGLVPGVGTVTGLVNAGLSLSGNPTIGGMIANDVPGEYSGGGNEYSGGEAPGGDAESREKAGKPGGEEEVLDFGLKYLGWRDDTPRPTPKQKWATGRAGYASQEYAA